MPIHPINNAIVTRDFYYLSTLYVGGQHAADDYIPRGRPATGEPTRAVADWEAVGVGWDFYSGFFVALDHAGGYRSFYRHLYGQSPVVIGQRGKQGDIIGNVGNTGWSQGAHLHFDWWNRNKIRNDAGIFYKNGWYALDPELYLGQEVAVAGPTQQEIIENLWDRMKAAEERLNQLFGWTTAHDNITHAQQLDAHLKRLENR